MTFMVNIYIYIKIYIYIYIYIYILNINILSWHFVVFHQKISVFIIFISFLIKYPQQNIKQSETKIDDDKLLVGLYG